MKFFRMCLCILIGYIANCPLTAFGYDKDNAHPRINLEAANKAEGLKRQLGDLGYVETIDKVFAGNQVKEWLRQGGKDEDSDLRVLSHFHDPLDSWPLAGLLYAQSALIWAQNTETNLYTWQKAREYYFQALSTGNEEYFAKTFKTLGHVMHLVADMAVPAHVRGDKHPTFVPSEKEPYEAWAESNHNNGSISYQAIPVSSSIFAKAVYDFRAPVPVSALWDHNIYDGSNPDATLSGAGLAEYTNANFFSKDTISTYPNQSLKDLTPGVDWLNPTQFVINGKTDYRVYLMGNVNGAIKLAGASLITYETMQQGYTPIWMLDDEVHQDYASRLIPAAVGYSRALLDYFFRGKINMRTDPANTGFIIKNEGNETLDGDFFLFYHDNEGNRGQIANWNGLYLAAGAEMRVPFYMSLLSNDSKTHGEFMLVFKGQMGLEEGAVLGRLEKLTPKHYVYFRTGAYATVWDLDENHVATDIADENGDVIAFPASATSLGSWLRQTKYEGEGIFWGDVGQDKTIWSSEVMRALDRTQWFCLNCFCDESPGQLDFVEGDNTWHQDIIGYSCSYEPDPHNYIGGILTGEVTISQEREMPTLLDNNSTYYDLWTLFPKFIDASHPIHQWMSGNIQINYRSSVAQGDLWPQNGDYYKEANAIIYNYTITSKLDNTVLFDEYFPHNKYYEMFYFGYTGDDGNNFTTTIAESRMYAEGISVKNGWRSSGKIAIVEMVMLQKYDYEINGAVDGTTLSDGEIMRFYENYPYIVKATPIITPVGDRQIIVRGVAGKADKGTAIGNYSSSRNSGFENAIADVLAANPSVVIPKGAVDLRLLVGYH